MRHVGDSVPGIGTVIAVVPDPTDEHAQLILCVRSGELISEGVRFSAFSKKIGEDEPVKIEKSWADLKKAVIGFGRIRLMFIDRTVPHSFAVCAVFEEGDPCIDCGLPEYHAIHT